MSRHAAGLDLGSVAEIVSESFTRTGWDAGPLLGVVVGYPGAIRVMGLPIPSELWQANPACEVLHGLAVRMNEDPPPPPDLNEDETPLGLLLSSEDYAAEVPPGTTDEEIDALDRWTETHSLADHPWGREVRNTYIVGFDGSLSVVVHVRDSGRHEADSFEHLDDWPSGCVIDALREFAIAVKRAMS